MNNIILLIDQDSPLYHEVKLLQDIPSIDITNKVAETHLPQFQMCIDFSTKPIEVKKNWYKRLSDDCQIFADLTCENIDQVIKDVPQIIGVFSTLFLNKSRKFEYKKIKEHIIPEIFNTLKISPIILKNKITVGFIYPRIISMIINEACFLYDENKATKEDIDKAMLYGVNYPAGPFQLSQNKEKFIKRILFNLNSLASDNRYEISNYLKRF